MFKETSSGSKTPFLAASRTFNAARAAGDWPRVGKVLATCGVVCLGSLGCGDSLTDLSQAETSEGWQGIRDGLIVNPADIAKTAAVRVAGCSGMLITPRRVLTAAHCVINFETCAPILSTGGRVVLNNSSISNNPGSTVGAIWVHPSWLCQGFGGAACQPYDAAILELDSPLYPKRSNGTTWERYRRDLYRGPMSSLVGSTVDVYGYGCSIGEDPETCTGSGTLRYARFDVEPNSTMLEYDGTAETGTGEQQSLPGDSGAAVLTPSEGEPGAYATYEVAGVNSCLTNAPGEQDNEAAPAAAIASWFDQRVSGVWGAFDAPSQIMAVLTRY